VFYGISIWTFPRGNPWSIQGIFIWLEGAAADVAQGLEPLDEGLDIVELDVENARTQLLGTGRTCKNLIDRFFVACGTGMIKARADECPSVMGELRKVYHQNKNVKNVRDLLDRIK